MRTIKETAKILAILAILGGAGYQPALSQVEKIVTVEVSERVDKLESEVRETNAKLDTMLKLLTSGTVQVQQPQGALDDHPRPPSTRSR